MQSASELLGYLAKADAKLKDSLTKELAKVAQTPDTPWYF